MPDFRTSDDVSRVEHIQCPTCGRRRPYDWFGQYEHCWRCRELKPEFSGVLSERAQRAREKR